MRKTAIKKGITRSVLLQKSASQSKSIIDEIIVIDLNLSQVAQSPLKHRRFAFFGNCPEPKLEINKSNLEDVLISVTDNRTKAYINMWFNSGGTDLTLYNYVGGEDVNPDVIEDNIIIAGQLLVDQQVVYDAYKTSTKRLFLTKQLTDTLNITPSRTSYVFIIKEDLTTPYNADLPIFQYLSKYTLKDFYRKNNFESSDLEGIKYDTLQGLVNSKYGSLVYIEDLGGYYYYNMVDTKGFNLNWDFLQADIKAKIQSDCLTVIANDSTYNQSHINTWHNTTKNALNYFKTLNKVNAYITSATTYNEQTSEDLQAGIYRQITIKYTPMPEIREIHMELNEDLSILEN